MFATLASGYSRLPREGQADHLGDARRLASRGEFDHRGLWVIENTLIRELVEEQQDAGLELLSDGLVRWIDDVGSFPWALRGARVGTDGAPTFDREPQWVRPVYVEAFRFLRSITDQPVRQYLLGPYSLARLSDPGVLTRERLAITLADAIRREIQALAAAGCGIVQVDEPAAATIATDAERTLFRAAHRRLTHAIENVHLMLSVLGNADRAGARTIFDARYHSYLFDLRDQPDNWLLVAQAPPTRGVIAGIGAAGAAAAGRGSADDPDQMRWAATMLAALRGRGPDRVGLAPAGSLDGLPRDVARQRIEVLGAVAFELWEQGRDGALPGDVGGLAGLGIERGWFGNLTGRALEAAQAQALPDDDEQDADSGLPLEP